MGAVLGPFAVFWGLGALITFAIPVAARRARLASANRKIAS
jgi:hypothetical protein